MLMAELLAPDFNLPKISSLSIKNYKTKLNDDSTGENLSCTIQYLYIYKFKIRP